MVHYIITHEKAVLFNCAVSFRNSPQPGFTLNGNDVNVKPIGHRVVSLQQVGIKCLAKGHPHCNNLVSRLGFTKEHLLIHVLAF